MHVDITLSHVNYARVTCTTRRFVTDITVLIYRRAKLGQIQVGLQRAIQNSTKAGLQFFFNFYALKIKLLRVFTLSD